MSDLVFQKTPNKPWFALLFGQRKGEELPLLRAEWRGVEPWKVSEYQSICGFEKTQDLPITYPQIMATPLHFQLLAHPAFPFPVLGLVHVSQKIEQSRPLRIDERPDLLTWCDGLTQVRRGVEFTIHTEARIMDEVVWKAETVTFSRSRKGHGQANRTKEPILEDVLKTISIDVPEHLGRTYCGISGDWNPIHVHMLLAKIFGFPRAIIHGMWSMARCVAELPETPRKVEAHFRRPIYLPSTVVLKQGSFQEHELVEMIRPDDGKRHLWVEAWV
ncbi:MAG: hypothetical protein CMK59_06010 [Proteobacteria bacterium]|nr:hypothetical protein [Pseudomonadota bacterium]